MKAKDLRERSDEDLEQLEGQLRRDLFGSRMKNFTGQLDDTSQLSKLRRDIARIAQVLTDRQRQGGAGESAAAAAGSES